MGVGVDTAKSQLLVAGARRVESTRDSVPKPQSGGTAKQEVLNHCATWPPPADLLHPGTTLGRTLETPRLAFSKGVPVPAQVILSGKPRWKAVCPSIPQPETNLFATPVSPAANLLP